MKCRCEGRICAALTPAELLCLPVILGLLFGGNALLQPPGPIHRALPSETVALVAVVIWLLHAIPLRLIHRSSGSLSSLAGLIASVVWTTLLLLVPEACDPIFRFPLLLAAPVVTEIGLVGRCRIHVFCATLVVLSATIVILFGVIFSQIRAS